MRKNLPVTDVEYVISDGVLIVSKTDLKGRLTYFNEHFAEASGYSDQELMGQPHNIVRHPDMPSEAFGNLWETLKAGEPWAGAVKNRRKDGSFYWVFASATPIWEDGQIAGYMSVRSRLSADVRDEAERVYAAIREGRGKRYHLEAGTIRKRSLLDVFSLFTSSVKARLSTLTAAFAFALAAIGIVGLIGMGQVDKHAKSIYEDRAVPLAQLFEINDRMKEDLQALLGGAVGSRASPVVGNISNNIERNIEHVSRTWNEYLATYLTPEEEKVAASFASTRVIHERRVREAVALLNKGKFEDLETLMLGGVSESFAAVKSSLDALVAIQVKEARAEYDAARRVYAVSNLVTLSTIALALLLGTLLAIATGRGIVRPLGHLTSIMTRIAQGAFNSRVYVERNDETGAALRNLQALQAKLGFERESNRDTERKAIEQRKLDMHRMANGFEAAVGEVIQAVASAAIELEASATTLTNTAASTRELSVAVASASEQASASVQSVASATRQMTSSADEVSRRVQDTSRLAANAVEQARYTNERVSQLCRATSRIGDIVQLIDSIAGQTNLLALNATIEAARAGNAGRGFAVVASEVKALAEQTAKATGEIGQQISDIQAAMQDSVLAIEKIASTIKDLSSISEVVSEAIDEQSVTGREISHSVHEAAQGALEVSSNIAIVQRGAAETGAASSQVLSSAKSLSVESTRLKSEVDRFLSGVRTA